MIRVDHLCFTHPGGIPALRRLDLEIRPREHLALIGPNGSGKTTLARCLNGLYLPQSGQVLVDGLSTRDPRALFEIRRRVGMVFQNPDDQLVATTVEDEIAFGLENLALPGEQIRRRVDEIIAAFGLSAHRRHPPHRLSGGEKQRVAIAAAVALRPRYLVLDEPTALLDPRGRRQIGRLLRSLRRRFDMATLHITQSEAEALRADRIIVLHQGRVLRDAPPSELFEEMQMLEEIGLEAPFVHALRARMGATLRLPPTSGIGALAEALAACWPHTGAPPAAAPAPLPARPDKLETRDLSYVYDAGLPTQRAGVVELSLGIPAGGICALVGPSGAGKTTLAQHFNALLKPQCGQVLLEGEDIWIPGRSQTSIRRRVGLVFQFPELQLFESTLAADVAFGPRNLGFAAARVEALVCAALDAVELPAAHFGPRPPTTLSGGEKRRAALAGVLAMDTEVLVLDEPTAGLDPHSTRQMAQICRRLRRAGKTLVLITHQMDLAARLATHVAVLKEGRLQLQGPTRRVLSHPDFVRLSGLEAPAPIQLGRALAARGCRAPTDWLTLDEAAAFLHTLYARN